MKGLKLAVAGLVLCGILCSCVWFAGIVSVDHWGYAISVNFLFMVYFTVVFDTVFVPRPSCGVFGARPFERGGATYKLLGVKQYARVLKVIGWEKIVRKEHPVAKDLEALKRYEAWTCGSEAIHFSSAIFVAAITVWVAWRYSLDHISWLVAVNILVNMYPIMLQRFNRARVIRLIEHHELRRTGSQ